MDNPRVAKGHEPNLHCALGSQDSLLRQGGVLKNAQAPVLVQAWSSQTGSVLGALSLAAFCNVSGLKVTVPDLSLSDDAAAGSCLQQKASEHQRFRGGISDCQIARNQQGPCLEFLIQLGCLLTGRSNGVQTQPAHAMPHGWITEMFSRTKALLHWHSTDLVTNSQNTKGCSRKPLQRSNPSPGVN